LTPSFPTSSDNYFDPDNVPDETWNLPATTVHHRETDDIIASIEVALEQGISMSVKVSAPLQWMALWRKLVKINNYINPEAKGKSARSQ
jgi:hypothetical protein